MYEYQQLESAVLAGFEATLHYHPHFLHGLHIQIDGSYVYGKDNNGNPVTSIPQPRLNSMFIYNFEMESKFKLKSIALQYQYYFKQDRVVENEINSEDYHILNASVDMLWDMKMPLNISVGAKNMLNSAYINHLSNLKDLGIMAPGYNVYIEFKWSLNKNLKK